VSPGTTVSRTAATVGINELLCTDILVPPIYEDRRLNHNYLLSAASSYGRTPIFSGSTQTGYQRRRPEQQIDRAPLLDSLKAVHKVADNPDSPAMQRVREGRF
jgi:hypothetical protein